MIKMYLAVAFALPLLMLLIRARTRRRHGGTRGQPLGGVCDASNPLDAIDAQAPDFLERCRCLAHQLVIPGAEREPFWDAAELILTAMIAFVCACEPDRRRRTLTTVRKLVSSRRAFAYAIEAMQQTEGFGGAIAAHGAALSWLKDRERESALAAVQRRTAWMDSPAAPAGLIRPSGGETQP